MSRIPHRYPMLMIDRVIDVVTAKSCTGIKNVSANEPFFQGHFPDHPDHAWRFNHRSDGADFGDFGGRLALDGVSCETHVVYFMTIEKRAFPQARGAGRSAAYQGEEGTPARQCLEIQAAKLLSITYWCAEAVLYRHAGVEAEDVAAQTRAGA